MICEKDTAGKAELRLDLRFPSIQFKGADKRQWQYLANKKCADSIVFQYSNDQWALHIFEIKTTVRHKDWETIKKQFDGAFLNALAMAGFLKIRIDRVTMHSCYRYDKLTSPMESAEIKQALTNRESREAIDSWRRPEYRLNYCENILCAHEKTQLDASGTGKIELR
jgi:hypothetical protein